MMTLEQYLKKIPDFKGANWLLRVPLGVIFILQGLQKNLILMQKFPIS